MEGVEGVEGDLQNALKLRNAIFTLKIGKIFVDDCSLPYTPSTLVKISIISSNILLIL